jgi:hypothetical protein
VPPPTDGLTPAPRSRSLDEADLERVSSFTPWLPEPLAALVDEVDAARDAGDATGVRKRLFELGVGVVRYGVSVGLAKLEVGLDGASAPDPVAQALRRAYRLTDGKWCDLLRTVGKALERVDAKGASALRFAGGNELQAFIAARNRFIHEGGSGDDAPACALRVLEAATALLEEPLRIVASLDPPLLEVRSGVPRRAGVWRKTAAELPVGLVCSEAYVGANWVRLTPWLPLVDGCLRLADSPPAQGKSWRAMLPETGEHKPSAPLDMAVRRLAGEDPSAPRAPTDRPSLVGREVALSLVRRAAEEAVAGGVRVLLFGGPQGAGHSRILREVTDAAAGLGFEVVVSVFGSRDRRAPLGALRRALNESPSAPDLQPVIGAVDRVQQGDALADRARVDAAIEAVEELLVAASRERPILLAVDDAQWLDEHSLALLRLLTERATRGAVGGLLLVVASQRDSSPSRGLASFVAQIDRDVGSGATRAPLAPLEAGDAKRIVQHVAPVAKEVERVLVDESGGLPFYLVQPLLVWVETAGLEWRDGAWRPRPVPEDPTERASHRNVLREAVPGVSELVHARVDALFEAGWEGERVAYRVLGASALHGVPIPIDRLVRVTTALGSPSEVVESVVASLVAASLLEKGADGAVRFTLPMVARALIETERVQSWWPRLHRCLLEDLERDPAVDPVALADGYSALGDGSSAVTWRWRALERRMAQGAFDEARGLAETLAESSPAPDDRVRAQLSAVEALLRAGDAAAAQTRLDAIQLPADLAPSTRVSWRLSAAALAVARRQGTAVDDSLIQDADTHGDRRDTLRSRLLLASLVRGERGKKLVAEALARSAPPAEGVEDLHYRLCALDLELTYELRTGSLEDLRGAAVRARDAARALGSTWAELDSMNDAAVLEADAGKLESALEALRGVADRAAGAGLGSIRRTAMVNASTLALRGGHPASAKTLAQSAAHEARQAGEVRQLAMALSVLAEAEFQCGDVGAARKAVDESIALREGWSDPGVAVAFLRRAEMLASLDDDLAVRDARRALERAEAAGNRDLQARAQLWLAMRGMSRDTPGARDHLRSLVEALTGVPSLRPATLDRLARARSLLEASRT